MTKKILSVLMVLLMLSSCLCLMAYAADTSVIQYEAKGKKTCTDPSDMLNFVLADGHQSAPIRIVKAKLKQENTTKNIYLIGLVGIEMNKGQVNVFKNALPSAFDIDNGYTKLLREVIADKIPAGSNIVLCGHSLGGMVAQQVAADNEIKDNYNVLYVLTAGSPFIVTKNDREGLLQRMCDKSDLVPYLSNATFIKPFTQFGTRNTEDGGFHGNPDDAHNISYRLSEVWCDYDAVGIQGGQSVITFNYADLMTFGKVDQ